MTLKNISLILVIQFLTLSIAHSNEKNPLFDGTMLKIPIVDTQEHFGLYQNVAFKPLADGKWELAGYNKREKGIYEIETVNLFLTEEPPIQGFLEVTAFPRDCRMDTRLIRTQLVGDTFNVFIDSNKPYPGTSSCQKMKPLPFAEIIPLPLYGIKSGDYKYTVNGEYQGVFNVSSDNVLEIQPLEDREWDGTVADRNDVHGVGLR